MSPDGIAISASMAFDAAGLVRWGVVDSRVLTETSVKGGEGEGEIEYLERLEDEEVGFSRSEPVLSWMSYEAFAVDLYFEEESPDL